MGAFDLFSDGLLREEEEADTSLAVFLDRFKTDTAEQIKDEQDRFAISGATADRLSRLAFQTGQSTADLFKQAETAAREDIATSITRQAREESRALADQRLAEKTKNLRKLDRVKALETNGVSRLFEDFTTIPEGLDQRTKLVQTGVSDTGTALFERINVNKDLTAEAKKAIRAQEVADFLDLPVDLVLERFDEEQRDPTVVKRTAEARRLADEKKAREIKAAASERELANITDVFARNPALLKGANLSPELTERIGQVRQAKIEEAAQTVAGKLDAKKQQLAVRFATEEFRREDRDPSNPEDIALVGRLVGEKMAAIGEAATIALSPNEAVEQAFLNVPKETKESFLKSATQLIGNDPFGIAQFTGDAGSAVALYRSIQDMISSIQLPGGETVGQQAGPAARQLGNVATGGALDFLGQQADRAAAGLQSFGRQPGEPTPTDLLQQRLRSFGRQPGEPTPTDLLLERLEEEGVDFGEIGAFFRR